LLSLRLLLAYLRPSGIRDPLSLPCGVGASFTSRDRPIPFPTVHDIYVFDKRCQCSIHSSAVAASALSLPFSVLMSQHGRVRSSTGLCTERSNRERPPGSFFWSESDFSTYQSMYDFEWKMITLGRNIDMILEHRFTDENDLLPFSGSFSV
jgi:hypothetical protein